MLDVGSYRKGMVGGVLGVCEREHLTKYFKDAIVGFVF